MTRSSVKTKKSIHPSKAIAVLDALEPRLLYSADITPLAMAEPTNGPQVSVQAAYMQQITPLSAQQSAPVDLAFVAHQTVVPHQVFVVDLRVADAQTLLQGLQLEQANARKLGEEFELLTVASNEDGIAKISGYLAEHQDVSALHIVSHGQNGMMLLGNQWLDNSAVRLRSADFSGWSNAFTANADILLYGCDFAQGIEGREAITALAKLTGADVAASVDTTANAAQGGNWSFEYTQGAVSADAKSLERAASEWRGRLASFVVTNTNNSGAGSLRSAINSANGTAGLDQITFNIAAPLVGGAHTINLLSALPDITDAVVIDGDTEPDAVALGRVTVELVGNASAFGGLNLLAGASGSTVSGLAITNFSDGITLEGNDITVRHNLIGLRADGATASGNTDAGIVVTGTGAVIGGTTAADRNVISGNLVDGIIVEGANAVIHGNYIGLGSDGETNVGNGSSGFGSGIYVNNIANIRIGGAVTGAGNFIANNRESAIYIGGSLATGSTVFNNRIGVTVSGLAAGNGLAGIELASGAFGNVIGGIGFAQSNLIANSGIRFASAGVLVGTTAGLGNTISGNRVYASSSLGIDTLNAGVNVTGLPDISVVTSNGATTAIGGRFQGEANTQYRIEFFSNDSVIGLDASGFGEGQNYIDSFIVTTNALGLAIFDGTAAFLTANLVPLGYWVSATATHLTSGTTSEFSAGKTVGAANIVYSSPGIIAVSESGTSASVNISLSMQPASDVNIPISISDTTEGSISTALITFTSANWNVTQQVILTGVSDTLADGTISYSVVIGSPTSTDPVFNAMPGRTFTAVTIDVDTFNTIVVDTTADVSDGDTSSITALFANRGMDDFVSLREAIVAANNTPNASINAPDHIAFNLTGPAVNGMRIIALSADLATITDRVVIDGASDPSYVNSPTVRIDGGGLYSGLELLSGSSNSTVNALAITGMVGAGISVRSDGNTFTRNYIGHTGLFAVANLGEGVYVTGTLNKIGLDNAGNVISGNQGDNVLLSGSAAQNNTVVANFVGTNASGGNALVNGRSGIVLANTGSGNVIGGLSTASRNTVSGNGYFGIELIGTTTQNTIVQNNLIGTDSIGSMAVGNAAGGLRIWNGASNNLVGGGLGGRNVISGNQGAGIQIDGVTFASSNNSIEGNFIGVNASGSLPIGNSAEGIVVGFALNTTIGGTTALKRNVISANGRTGIVLSAGADYTVIQGNYIGLDYTGFSAYAGLGANGIAMSGATHTRIGGTAVGSGNVISGNTNAPSDADGIYVNGGSDTLIEGNLIGFAADGLTPRANYHGGVVFDNTSNATLGGTDPRAANTIANSPLGVIVASSSTNVAILGNRISNSSAIPAIDLSSGLNGDGLTLNDPLDIDMGANGLQNFPVLLSAQVVANGFSISGSLNSEANKNYRIEFFSSVYLGSLNVTTDGAGNAIFSNELIVATVTAGENITATATEVTGAVTFGGTSEFARNTVLLSPAVQVNVAYPGGLITNETGGSIAIAYSLSAAPIADVIITFALSDASEASLSVSSLTFTPLNWSATQLVSVNGLNDAFVDGSVTYTLSAVVTSPGDALFNSPALSPLSLTNLDNDTSNVLVVDTAADVSDGDTSSIAALYANKGLDGKVSLREALLAANATVNGTQPDEILFDIGEAMVAGAHSILLTSLLPEITDAVVINGTTEPDFSTRPVIEITGANAVAQGLTISASGSTIKGLAINAFAAQGILIYQGAADTQILGNHIGTDVTGLIARGNGSWGIDVIASPGGTVIGGETPTSRNVISNNAQGAIAIGNSQGSSVIGNYLGVASDGLQVMGNGWGIFLNANTTGTVISNNTIAHSLAQGIVFISPESRATILGNRIYGNTGLGIDFAADGVTVNDVLDGDMGANDLQNFPVLQVATSNGGNSSIVGTLNSQALTAYRIEFFASPAAHVSEYGQGELILGALDVVTDAQGNASFTNNFVGVSIPMGWVVSATATTNLGVLGFGVTSEMSRSIAVTSAAPAVVLTNIAGASTTSELGAVTTFSIYLSTQPMAEVTINLSLSVMREGQLSASSIAFTAANWNVPQLVNVRGLDDSVVDGSVAYLLNLSSPMTNDLGYALVAASSAPILNSDNDSINAVTVNTHSDLMDGDVSSIAALYANKGSDGLISLREAITAANNTANASGADRILFDISVPGLIEINLNAALPIISDEVFIDGTSQPDFYTATNTRVQISAFDSAGGRLGAGISGLVFTASNSTVRGLEIRGFDGAGIVVRPGVSGIALSQMQFEGNAGLSIDLGDDGATLNDPADLDVGANHLQNGAILNSVTTNGIDVIWLNGGFNGRSNSNLIVEVYEHGTSTSLVDKSRLVGSFVITTDAMGNASFLRSVNASFDVGTRFSLLTTDITNAADSNTSEFSAAVTSTHAEILVSAISNDVDESGTTAFFTVVLSAEPSDDVTISLVPSVLGEVSLSTSAVVFTRLNWNVAQSVIVIGLQDLMQDGSVSLSILTATAQSSDPRFNGFNAQDVSLVNRAVTDPLPPVSMQLPSTPPDPSVVPLGFSGGASGGSELGYTNLFAAINTMQAMLDESASIINAMRVNAISLSVSSPSESTAPRSVYLASNKNSLSGAGASDGTLEQQTNSAIARLDDIKKKIKASFELSLLDAQSDTLLQKQFSGSSLSELLAAWKSNSRSGIALKTPVLIDSFDLPSSATAGFVQLEDIQETQDYERYRALVAVLELSGFAVSAATVAWIARATGLAAALIAAVPAWKVFDPLHVLSSSEKIRANESLDFVDTEIRSDEEAVGAVLF
jgi:CSLREA domain-containing protein